MLFRNQGSESFQEEKQGKTKFNEREKLFRKEQQKKKVNRKGTKNRKKTFSTASAKCSKKRETPITINLHSRKIVL